VKVYADTSFLAKLLNPEIDSAAAAALYRSLKRPPLLFLPLHGLEVTNAIRQRAFHLRRTLPKGSQVAIERERNAALERLQTFLVRRLLARVHSDFDAAMEKAQALSEKNTERLGCRGFDLLHVAFALNLGANIFVTADENQAQLARAEGLDVRTLTSK
jgi:predicted nucleic acid-binding protein